MSNYQQQPPQRPYYGAPAGQGQPPAPGQQQQQPFAGPGAPYGNARPGPGSGPGPMNPAMRPGPGPGGPMTAGARPIGQGQPPARPPPNAYSQQPQQQQQHPGVRPSTPGAPPGARPPPPGAVRPANQQQPFRPPSPLQAQQAGAAMGVQPQAHQGPSQSLQSPPRPPSMGGASFPQNTGVPSGQNVPYRPQPPQPGYQAQQPTPPIPSTEQHGAAGSGLQGLNNQMSHMSLGGGIPPQDHQQPQEQQTLPTGPPRAGSEAKPKAGARPKRAYATDPSTAPVQGGQAGMMPPPIPQPGAPEPYGNQQNFGHQQQHQGFNQGPPAQQHPGYSNPNPPYQQQQPPPPYQPPLHMGQQQHQQPHPQPHQQQHRPGGFSGQPVARPKIDPNNIPSPVAVQETDQDEWDQKPFVTSARTNAVPLASSDFLAIDGGNCNPRFFRMTTYNVPTTEELLTTSQLPLGLIIQPLAQLRADEAPIETVDFGDSGPARCRRCNAYINPYMMFTSGGQRFVCNMCLFENEVDPSYFCNLDMNGRRCDLDQRPELRNGTIEFAVPKEYWGNKTPTAAAYVFAIDVSWNSVQSGMLQQCVEGVKHAIWDEEGRSRLVPGAQIGILTYDKNVHFYNLSPGLEQAQMMVVPDIADIFVPLSNGFLVNPETSQVIVESMLDMLPQLFAENKTTEPVIGAVVQAVRMALESRGGKLIIFQTALPNFGPGALRHREESKLYGTDKEKQLYAPQEDFYPKLAESCVDAALSIDLFLFPNAYIDVATLGCLSSLTGGDTYMFPNFNAARDGVKLQGEIRRLVNRPFGFNALMRVRCSGGLRIAEHFGNFHMKNSTDLEIAGIDSEKAIGVLVKHDGKLDERVEASFQIALLYTTADGRRRVRVHNFSTPVTSLLGNVFRWADMDTTINFLSKGAIAQALNKPLSEVREALTEKCVKILSAYRRNCASSTAPGQLILPESFKLFPIYTLAMLKSRALRVGRDITSDVRVYNMRMTKSMGVSESVAFYYPRMIAVHEMNDKVGLLNPLDGRVFLPPLVRVSYARLESSGAYLLENGQKMFLWLGREINPQFLLDVFGVATLEEIHPEQRQLPELDTMTSSQLREIRSYMQRQRPRFMDLTIVRQGMDQSELEFSNLLVEDQNNEAMSYVDYLPTIHKMIQNEVTSRPHEVHTSMWSR